MIQMGDFKATGTVTTEQYLRMASNLVCRGVFGLLRSSRKIRVQQPMK